MSLHVAAALTKSCLAFLDRYPPVWISAASILAQSIGWLLLTLRIGSAPPATRFWAVSVRQPAVSLDTIASLRTSISSSFAIAVISWRSLTATTWPRLIELAVAQALTMWITDLLLAASKLPRR